MTLRLSLSLAVVITLTCCSGNRADAPSALPVDLMVVDPPAVPTAGFRPVERAAGVDFRWVLGPKASLVLNLERPTRLVLSLTASNPLEGQTVTVLVNGRAVEKLENIPRAARLTGFRRYEILTDAPSGTVEIALEFACYNHRSAEDTFAPEDKEPLAMTISGLTITPANP